MNDYTTPEGFTLYKPLLMPDVRRFDEVLRPIRAWDFATMNHRNGYPQAATPAEQSWHGMTVSPFCSVRVPGCTHLQVEPTEAVIEVLRDDTFGFWENVGFEAIFHKAANRVLVLASCTSLISTRWLAYVDPASVPTIDSLKEQAL